MRHILFWLRSNWILSISLLGGFFLRIIFLDRFPVSITGDELVYVFNARLFFLGSSILQGWNPLSVFIFQYPPGVFPQAELPYLIALITNSASSLWLIRLPYVCMSTILIAVMYLLGRELVDEKTGRVVALLTAINPWFIVMGRTAYEVTPATLFYLLGIVLLLKAKKPMLFVLSFVMFLLGFYSYIGTKVIFAPIIITTCVYLYKQNKLLKKTYFIFSFAAICIVLISFLLLRLQPMSRVGELFLPTHPSVAQEVIHIRQATIPFVGETLFVNKATVYLKLLAEKTTATFSLDVLFTHGDLFFGLAQNGLFYTLDLLFLLVGLVLLFQKNMRVGIFLICLFIIGLLPQIFYKHISLFTPHTTFLFPIMILFIGYGIMSCIEKLPYKKLIMSVIVIGYIYLSSQFVITYFFQYPLSAQSDLPTKILSSYIARTDVLVTVYSNHREDLYKKYLIYQNRLTAGTLSHVDEALAKKDYQIGAVRFESCDTKLDSTIVDGIIVTQSECGNITSDEPFTKLALIMDGGEVFRIYHDSVCSQYNLPYYPAKQSLRQFDIASLSNKDFCETFISK